MKQRQTSDASSVPGNDGSRVHGKMLCPLAKAFCIATYRDQGDESPVALLGSGISPTAVGRLIPFIIVDAVYAETNRAGPHVSEECVEALLPLTANSDSDCPIPFEGRVIGVGTTSHHSNPNAMLACSRHPMATSDCASFDFSHAPARLSVAAFDLGSDNDAFRTAITVRKPSRSVIMRRVVADNCEFIEPMSGDIDLLRHNANVANTNAAINANVGVFPC